MIEEYVWRCNFSGETTRHLKTIRNSEREGDIHNKRNCIVGKRYSSVRIIYLFWFFRGMVPMQSLLLGKIKISSQKKNTSQIKTTRLLFIINLVKCNETNRFDFIFSFVLRYQESNNKI